MRILLANDVPLESGHGTEQHLVALAAALRELGHQVVVVTGQRWSGPLEETPGSLTVPDLTAPFLRKRPIRNVLAIRRAIAEVGRFVHRFDPDVIHVHNLLAMPALRALQALRPVVKSIHDCRPVCWKPPADVASRLVGRSERLCDRTLGPGCWSRCYRFGGPRRLVESAGLFAQNLLALRQVRKCDRLVVYSDYLRGLAVKAGIEEERLDLLPLFTGFPVVKEAALPEGGGRRILFVGQLTREKGVLHLLEALRDVPKPVELTMIGDGPLREKVAEMARGIPGLLLSLPGYVPHDRLVPEYRSALFVAVPSVGSEGCPTVGIEALANGKPVVGFDVGGVGEWLVDGVTGYLVPRLDVRRLGERIRDLLGCPGEVLRMGRAGRDLVESKFQKRSHVERLIGVYSRAIEGSGGLERGAARGPEGTVSP